MISTNDLFKAKELPKWITSHPVFEEVDKIGKVFPRVGLPNVEGDCAIDNHDAATKSAKRLISSIRESLTERIRALKAYGKDHPNINAARKTKLKQTIELLEAIKSQTKVKEDCIVVNNGKITLNLPADITLDGEPRPTLRKGEGLFRVYNKVNDLLKEGRFNTLYKLEDFDTFKTFSADNIPNNQFKIVFSSEGADGLWDIATMSMRGVSSCQSWKGEYKHCVIGSLIDPFVGIIYLTSGNKFNEYGSKMIKRCIVRFAISKKDKKPVLVLDNMYPEYEKKVADQFVAFLKERTGGKFDIIYAARAEKALGDVYMPLTDIRRKLQGFGPRGKKKEDPYDYLGTIQSYQDFHIKNATPDGKDKQAQLFAKNSKKKEGKFIKNLSDSISDAIKKMDVASFPNASRPAIRKLKGNDKNYWNHTYVVTEMARTIAKNIISEVDKENFTNSDTYMRRVYYSYFLNKNKIVESLKTKMSRDLNGKLALKNNEKLNSATVVSVMKTLLPEVDAAMKKELMELVEKRKEKFSGALPLPG